MTVDQNQTPSGISDAQERAELPVTAPDPSSLISHAEGSPLTTPDLADPSQLASHEPGASHEPPAAEESHESVSDPHFTAGHSHPESEPTPLEMAFNSAVGAPEADASAPEAPNQLVPEDVVSGEPEADHRPEATIQESSQEPELPAAVSSESVSHEPAVLDHQPSEPVVAEPVIVVPVVAAAEVPEVVVEKQVAPAATEAVAAPAEGEPERPVAADSDLFDSYMSAMDRGEDPEAAIDSTYKRLQKGDRIEATIIQVDRDKVFVDLGTKAEGIVPLGELSEENLETAKGLFNVGDKISVVVIRPEGSEGNPIVSKKRADFEEIWDRIEAAFKSQEMITAQVVDRVKGGLVVDVGVRGFVPATHVGSGKLRNIEKFVGQPLQLKVIEIDRERKKVVLSNRQAEEERKQTAKEEIFQNVKPGDILEGSVRRLADYGAFVDLGGVDGLLHISEMSWARINHPKEMFREGQKIKVMVLRLDEKAGKISLGHRQVLPDPWNLIKQNYRVGQTLKITIGRIVQSGAFIKLAEGAEAFLPVSEMSYRRVKRPQDVVEENQEVDAQVIDLRPDERRMVLSMKAVGGGGSEPRTSSPGGSDGPPSYDDDRSRGKDRGKKGAKKGRGGGRDFDDDFEDVGRRGYATGGATIGERLGMLKGFLGRDEDEDEKPAAEAGEASEETEA